MGDGFPLSVQCFWEGGTSANCLLFSNLLLEESFEEPPSALHLSGDESGWDTRPLERERLPSASGIAQYDAAGLEDDSLLPQNLKSRNYYLLEKVY